MDFLLARLDQLEKDRLTLIQENQALRNELNDEKIFKIIVSGRTRWKAVRLPWGDFNKLQSTVGSKTSNQKSPPYPPPLGFPEQGNAHQDRLSQVQETFSIC